MYAVYDYILLLSNQYYFEDEMCMQLNLPKNLGDAHSLSQTH